MSPVPQLAHNKLEAADAVRDPVVISEKPSAKAAETDKPKVDKAGLFSGKAFLQNPFTSTHEASSASSGAAYTAGLDFFAVPNLGGLFRASKAAAGVSNHSDAVAPRKPVHKQQGETDALISAKILCNEHTHHKNQNSIKNNLKHRVKHTVDRHHSTSSRAAC